MNPENEDYQGTEPEEIRQKLKDLGKMLGEVIPKEWGFTLLLFNYGEGGNILYISSAQRETMIKAMYEFIAKQKV